MSIPTLTNTVGGMDIHWDDNPFVFKFTQLRAHRDGRITGFLTVHSNNKELEFIYPSTQINIVADRTRASLIKALESRTSVSWRWEELVFQFSQLVQDYVRAGEPATEMWAGLEDTEVEPPNYLIYPLLAEGLPNAIFGKRGTVKSTLALTLISLLLLGSRENTLKLSATKEEIRSLYLDYELDFKPLNYQFYCVQQGLGFPPVMLTYRRCYLPIAQDIEQIMYWVEKSRAQFLVIDSAGPACGGEPEKAGPVIEMFSAIRRLNITTLIIGHTSHEDEGKEKHIYGSVFFENEARNIWESRIIQEAGDKEVDMGLFNTKPPPFSGKHPPLGYHLSFQQGRTLIEPRDPKNIDEFVQRMGNNQRILHHLKTGAYTPKELAEALSLNPGSVRVSLGRLEGKKLVVKIGEKYGLQSNF